MLRDVLPEDLLKYFEYIPDNRLAEVFVGLIREALASRLNPAEAKPVFETGEIVQNIMQLLQGNSPNNMRELVTSVRDTPVEEVQIEPVEAAKLVDITSVVDTDDDLGDLMDLLK